MAEESSVRKPGGTSYGQVIADGYSTLTFASAFVDLVGRPLSGLLSKKSAKDEYLVQLGEWADQAADKHGRWLQPMLRTAAFEEHLVREEGHPKPSGVCESSLAWAQLLYALKIRPRMKVVTWRLLPRAIDPGVEGVRLVVDGVVMCHIINLFRIHKDPMPMGFSRKRRMERMTECEVEENACEFDFGTISVDVAPEGRPAKDGPET
jgi:hypothetical protein